MPARRYDGEWWRLRHRLGRQRHLVAALLAAVAIVLALSAAHPKAQASAGVWVATRDLTGGEPLSRADVRLAQVPVRDVPAHSLPAGHTPAGQVLAAPVRAGEPLTDVRLLSSALLAAGGSPGQVAMPVRISDLPATLALVQPGGRVDVLAGDDPSSGLRSRTGPVVQDVRVLAVPTRAADDGSGVVIVAATAEQADALAAVPAGEPLTLALIRNG